MAHPPRSARSFLLRIAVPALLAFAPVTSEANAVEWSPEGPLPPLGDFYAEWIRAQIDAAGHARALSNDADLLASLLLEPSSPYSRRLQVTQFDLEGPEWTTALKRIDEAGYPMTSLKARNVVAWDLGLYKAIPRNRPISYDMDRMDPLAKANLVKAGVSHGIYKKALQLVGKDHFAIAAQYAVAVQIVYDRFPLLPEQRRFHAGLRGSAVANFMSAGDTHDMIDGDWDYLIRRLQGRLNAWEVGKPNMYGQREIATALRVARVAAAYRQEIGYSGSRPCNSSGSANRDVAALNLTDRTRELCTNDATDRAVYIWYRQQLADQLIPAPSRGSPWPSNLVHVIEPVARQKSFWQSTFPDAAGEHAMHAEVMALLLAQRHTDDPVFNDAEASRIAERASEHFCKAY